MKKHLFPVLVLAGLALTLAACTSADAPSNEAAATTGTAGSTVTPEPQTKGLGQAPDFVLPTLAGDSLRLADLRGQIVLLNFWATWCAPCVEEIPELVSLHDELNPHGFTVVGISLDEEGPDFVKAFTDRFDISYPLPLDDGTVAESFGGVFALPTTYVIDAEGQIMQRVIGLFPIDEMRAEFRQMLDLPPVSTTSH